VLRDGALTSVYDHGVAEQFLSAPLHDLVVEGGELTRSLLGGPPA
jgi:hypothetical protein